jgi:hypothetical protein
MLIVAIMMIYSEGSFENGISGFMDQLNAIDPKLTQTTNQLVFCLGLFRNYFAQIVISSHCLSASYYYSSH